MSIQDLGSLGEFASSIAVIISLIYLAIQVKAGSKEMRSSQRHAFSESINTTIRNITANENNAQIFLNGINDFDVLDEHQKMMLRMNLGIFIGQCDDAYHSYLSGLLAPGDIDPTLKTLKGFLRTPGGKRVWNYIRDTTTQEFALFVESEVLAPDNTSYTAE